MKAFFRVITIFSFHHYEPVWRAYTLQYIQPNSSLIRQANVR